MKFIIYYSSTPITYVVVDGLQCLDAGGGARLLIKTAGAPSLPTLEKSLIAQLKMLCCASSRNAVYPSPTSFPSVATRAGDRLGEDRPAEDS